MKYTCCFDFRDVDQNIKIVNIFVTISQMYFLNIFVAEFKEKRNDFIHNESESWTLYARTYKVWT